MNNYNLGTEIKYEIWGTFHLDKENYPDIKFHTMRSLDDALEFEIPKTYNKMVIRVKTDRHTLMEK